MGLTPGNLKRGVSIIAEQTIRGATVTYLARYRRLTHDDVGGTALDMRGRPIIATEGVFAFGSWELPSKMLGIFLSLRSWGRYVAYGVFRNGFPATQRL